MLFPSRRASDYQNHSTQNACFISILFPSFWILYSDTNSFLLQWDISEGYKMWHPFWGYVVYLIIHPYFLDLVVCLWASFSKICIFNNQWHSLMRYCLWYLANKPNLRTFLDGGFITIMEINDHGPLCFDCLGPCHSYYNWSLKKLFGDLPSDIKYKV